MVSRNTIVTLVLLSFTAPLRASIIYVSGGQTGTWPADTVVVTGEVRVPPGQTLTILPGVEVLFSVYCKLIVDNGAVLNAVGTEADSIRFDALPPNSSWHGLRFLSASSSSCLEYCHITHGAAMGSGADIYGGGIYVNNSSPTVRNCLIDRCIADPGGYWWGTGGGIALFYSNAQILNSRISGNTAMHGGGISADHCYQLVIKGNTISGNISVIGSGGGVRLWDANPEISGNIISGNSATGGGYGVGGGICIWAGSAPVIAHNIIIGNSANAGGGILAESSSIYYVIAENYIAENSAIDHGGGISCMPYIGFNYLISGNTIKGNSSVLGGGIYYNGEANASIVGNLFSANTATFGGGIYCDEAFPGLSGNTISANIAQSGGGMYSLSSNPNLVNCILWGNVGQQITGAANITYTDIQEGYAGVGNINVHPAFVDPVQCDYRLQWGSPCIDAGDPNLFYNDPDGTRADMGAYYYDQSMPVRILLTPYNSPIKIPAGGGSFQYAIQVTNIADTVLTVLSWCNMALPSGVITEPLAGPSSILVESGQTLSWIRTGTIPSHASAGMYHYNANAVVEEDRFRDSFMLMKAWSDSGLLAAGGWANIGEKEVFNVFVSPNPFNQISVISYQLPVGGIINLTVYDITGREVAALAEGFEPCGWHQVVFNGGSLSSGVYFVRLVADGRWQTVRKAVVMK